MSAAMRLAESPRAQSLPSRLPDGELRVGGVAVRASLLVAVAVAVLVLVGPPVGGAGGCARIRVPRPLPRRRGPGAGWQGAG